LNSSSRTGAATRLGILLHDLSVSMIDCGGNDVTAHSTHEISHNLYSLDAVKLSQNEITEQPSGVTAPIPVTTTLLCKFLIVCTALHTFRCVNMFS
jgi:hypothetical protein